jgi:hypothetical protein
MRLFLFLFSFLILLSGCKENPPVVPPDPPPVVIKNSINLTAVWADFHRINLKWNKSVDDTLNSFKYNLFRKDETGNDTLLKIFNSPFKDTTYTDGETDSLFMGNKYYYRITAIDEANKIKDTSITLTAETLKPTSHDIEWRIDTLGQPGNFLKDVWGFDDNNVYAVGGINHNDGGTTLIKWDGINWNYHSFPDGSANSIFGFNNNDLIIVGEWANRGFAGHYNNSNWTEYKSDYFLSKGDTVYSLNAVWGSSPDNVWAVGQRGTIIHWDGQEWRKAKNIDERYSFWDVWGFNENTVYAAGNERNNETVLYFYNGSNWEKIFTGESIGTRRSSVWGPYEEMFYLIDYRHYIFQNKIPALIGFKGRRSPISKIRGEGINNIFTVGDFTEIFHFDGLSWKRFDELYTYPLSSLLFSCTVINGKFFGVGYHNNKALIIQGTEITN